MDSAKTSRLEAILAAYESEIAREQDRIDQEHMAEVLFAQQFAALKMNVILPAFSDLERELERHGHRCRIVETDEFRAGDVDGAGGGITCEFHPNGWDRGDGVPLASPPSLTVSCDVRTKTVKLSECTFGPLDGGWSGELGSFSVEEITRERIADAFVALVEKILLDKSFIAKSIQNLRPTWTRPGTRSETTTPTNPEIGRARDAA